MMNENYTMIALDEFLDYDFENEILPGVEYIKSLDELSLFTDGIKKRIVQLGYEADLEDKNKIVRFILNLCEDAGVKLNRPTVKNWFVSGNADSSEKGRKNIYKLCFALKMNTEQTIDFFLKCYLERPFNYKDIHEAVAFFCLNTGRSYSDLLRIVEQIEKIDYYDNPDAEDVTENIGRDIQKIADEKEFIDYIVENRSGFTKFNKTATENIDKLLKKCNKLAEKHRIKFFEAEITREIKTVDDLLHVIYGYAARGTTDRQNVYAKSIAASDFPVAIKRNFPHRQQFEQIFKGTASYDVLRKALIMLGFFRFFADVDLDGIESGEYFDEFAAEIDSLLNESGYVQMYWRNPFDWMMGYCACSLNPLEELRLLIDEFYLSKDGVYNKEKVNTPGQN